MNSGIIKNFNDISLTYTYALRSIGKGLAATRINAAVQATEDNDGSKDIAAAFDGSWYERGHTSLNCALSVTSFYWTNFRFGEGRLTDGHFNNFRRYYRLTIRNNLGSTAEMRKAIWATYFIACVLMKSLSILFALKRRTPGLGASDAVLRFNKGPIAKTNVFQRLQLKPGKFMVKVLQAIDKIRLIKAERKQRNKLKKTETDVDAHKIAFPPQFQGPFRSAVFISVVSFRRMRHHSVAGAGSQADGVDDTGGGSECGRNASFCFRQYDLELKGILKIIVNLDYKIDNLRNALQGKMKK
ncbi:hypothetical protein J6590_074883 [Homalodisca vitripennis]|nr:hypothetical protein J6590_074883 [Homalodisca vitripennis]